jgi:hypothetical protein
MDNDRFETWLRTLEDSISRRGMLGLIGGLGLAAAPTIAGAKRGKRRTRRTTPARAANGVSAASKSAPAGQGRYQTLAAKWWAWVIGEDLVPLNESDAVDCAVGQQGNTWFLAGANFPDPLGSPVTEFLRTCEIPAGTKLFFPVINAFAAGPPAHTACTLEPERTQKQKAEHQQCLADFLDANVDPDTLTAFVDGDPASIVRARSALFPLDLDADNPFGAPAGHYLETADGYWVLLDPLPPGEHTIAFTAEFAGDSAIDVTYEITIV